MSIAGIEKCTNKLIHRNKKKIEFLTFTSMLFLASFVCITVSKQFMVYSSEKEKETNKYYTESNTQVEEKS